MDRYSRPQGSYEGKFSLLFKSLDRLLTIRTAQTHQTRPQSPPQSRSQPLQQTSVAARQRAEDLQLCDVMIAQYERELLLLSGTTRRREGPLDPMQMEFIEAFPEKVAKLEALETKFAKHVWKHQDHIAAYRLDETAALKPNPVPI